VSDAVATRGGFRVPGYPWAPVLLVLAAAYVVAGSAVANPRNALIGTGLLALGVPVYLAQQRVRTPLDESSGAGHI